MKSKGDPRHQKRVLLMKELFSHTFHEESSDSEIKKIVALEPEIDVLIKSCAPDWPIEQINKVDLSILRLSIYELKTGDVPYKVIIDEAVELAKEYGSDKSAKFVNGVLGSAMEKLNATS